MIKIWERRRSRHINCEILLNLGIIFLGAWVSQAVIIWFIVHFLGFNTSKEQQKQGRDRNTQEDYPTMKQWWKNNKKMTLHQNKTSYNMWLSISTQYKSVVHVYADDVDCKVVFFSFFSTTASCWGSLFACFISALFLYFVQAHPYLKWTSTLIFPPS